MDRPYNGPVVGGEFPHPPMLGNKNRTFEGHITYSKSGGIIASSETRAMLNCLSQRSQVAQNLSNFFAVQGVSTSDLEKCLTNGNNSACMSFQAAVVSQEISADCMVAMVVYTAAIADVVAQPWDPLAWFLLGEAAASVSVQCP